MGKLQQFAVTFTENKVVYSPGDSLSGVLKITAAQPLQFKAIKVNCVGFCGISNKANDTTWVEQEQYFSSTLTVEDKGTLKQGEHTFPFQFLIPASAPTSYEGTFGRTVYKVRAFLETPRFSKDHETQKLFSLLKPVNLNDIPGVEQANTTQVTKTFSYHLMKTGTISVKAKTDLRGYIAGQVIQLITEIHNKSDKSTSSVSASLVQKVTYKAKKDFPHQRTIVEVEGQGVKGGRHVEWKEQIIVPPLPQSGLAGCTLIAIDYFIKVSLKSPEVFLILPIYIGDTQISILTRTPSRPVPPTPTSCETPNEAAQEPPRPTPRSRIRTSEVAPSAPPAELQELLPEQEIHTKAHSQQNASRLPPPVAPRSSTRNSSIARSPPCPGTGDVSGRMFCLATGATIPYYSQGDSTPVPTTSSLILPPQYSSWEQAHEPPPSYEESCSSNGSGSNRRS